MEHILTAAQMKKCDENTSKIFGIDSMVLMERAALETARIIIDRYGTDICVGIAAGSGNNGGDGVAIARILKESGVQAEVNLVGNPEKCTLQLSRQIETAKKLGIRINYGMENYSYDVIVDAMFGVGLSREVEGKYRETIERINESKAYVVAVDIPSGINTDNGNVMGCAVKADITVTYAYRKLGLMLYPGAEYSGEVICVPIGIPDEALDDSTKIITYNESDLKLPARNPAGNKGSFGKVLLVAGSKSMGGACQLSAMSTMRIGAGMVRLFTARDNRDILLQKLPEVIIDTYDDNGEPQLSDAEYNSLKEGIKWSNVVAIGPGLSTSSKAHEILRFVIEENNKNLVVDADALNLLSQDKELFEKLMQMKKDSSYEVIFTPHLGEFSRLAECSIKDIKKDIIKMCESFVEKYDVILVCKDARTIVTKQSGHIYLNSSGNDGMATAGSGDVLTGIIAGLLAQGMEPFEAAKMGTFVHGLAGDIAKNKTSAYYIMSQDIIQSLKYVGERNGY